MKFEITRTSMWNNEKPCKNSKLEIIKDYWKNNEKIWTIEINTLEELLLFKKQVGYNIILKNGSIEIYDDYGE